MSLLERIYYFHSYLLNDRYPNSGDLVREFEVSLATAHRDITYLRDRLLAPLAFNQKKNGYYYTETNFRLPFEDTPRLVMLLGMLQKMAGETGLAELPELKKLQNRLSQLVSTKNHAINDLVHCEWIETESVDSGVFSNVLSSLLSRKQLEITYHSPAGKDSTRKIDPLKLVNYQGRWYILAWCHLRQSKRMFHLARITSTNLTNTRTEHALAPGDDWLTGSFGIFKGDSAKRYRAEILLNGTAAEIVRHQRWHPEQEVRETPDGLILSLPVSDDRELIMKILQFGSLAYVLKPDNLRNKVRDEVKKMVTMYTHK